MAYDVEHYRELLRRELPNLTERFHVSSLALFGSFVRGENRPDSGLDVLVEFSKTPGLFAYIELENHLSDVLGISVDLVTADGLKPRVKERVLQQLVRV
jgi:predicted nucleotidyltransferase